MIVKVLKFVEIDGDNVVDSVVDVTEMFLILWEDWSFEKTWLTEWLCDWQKVTTREAIASKNTTFSFLAVLEFCFFTKIIFRSKNFWQKIFLINTFITK